MKKSFVLFVFITVATIIYISCKKQSSPDNLKLPVLTKNNLTSTYGNIAEIDINKHDSCYYWTKAGKVSSGTTVNSTAYTSAVSYTLPLHQTGDSIVAIAIGLNDSCYYYYHNQTVSVGTYFSATAYKAAASVALPTGETTSKILSIAISRSTGKFYTWYKDSVATIGSARNLYSVMGKYTFTAASGSAVSNIVGIGVKGSNDHTYAWYNNTGIKTVSQGTTTNLGYYATAISASF